jgi:hypothetical protein
MSTLPYGLPNDLQAAQKKFTNDISFIFIYEIWMTLMTPKKIVNKLHLMDIINTYMIFLE